MYVPMFVWKKRNKEDYRWKRGFLRRLKHNIVGHKDVDLHFNTALLKLYIIYVLFDYLIRFSNSFYNLINVLRNHCEFYGF